MQSLGLALYALGIAVTLAALVWSFLTAFRESRFLAVLGLFLPLGLPALMLMRLPRTWRPLAAWGVGLAVLFGGLALRRPGR